MIQLTNEASSITHPSSSTRMTNNEEHVWCSFLIRICFSAWYVKHIHLTGCRRFWRNALKIQGTPWWPSWYTMIILAISCHFDPFCKAKWLVAPFRDEFDNLYRSVQVNAKLVSEGCCPHGIQSRIWKLPLYHCNCSCTVGIQKGRSSSHKT